MKTTATRFAIGLGTALGLSAASAAHSQSQPQSLYELTGYVGYQSGGDFDIEGTDEEGDVRGQVAYAVAMNFRADTEGQYQVFYSRQPTSIEPNSVFPGGLNVDIDYVHFGGTLRVNPDSPLEPYIVGTVGATLLSPDFPGADDKQVFSVAVGAGLRIPVRKQFNLLFEARAFVSLMPAGGALFCSSGETGAGCRLHGSGSTFTQYVVLLGASFPF